MMHENKLGEKWLALLQRIGWPAQIQGPRDNKLKFLKKKS
jgi:hypothetical protein